MRILAFGDSLTAGFGLRPGMAFPDQLQEALVREGWSTEMLNAGLNGDTTGGGLARIEQALGSRPDLVLLELGTNDELMGIAPERVRKNLEGIILACSKARARVLLAGTQLAVGWLEEPGAGLAPVYEDLARRYALHFCPDLLEGVAGQVGLTLEDGIHPNERGATRMARNVLPVVRRALEPLASG